MDSDQKHIIIIAGEASGDIHAANLIKAIKKKNPNIHFSGLGGQHMKNEGVDIIEDLTKRAIIGVFEVIKHYNDLKRIFNTILNKIKKEKPDAVIFVDYPGFNLRLAKHVKKLGIKTIYYISPKAWAWDQKRVFLVKKYIDKMLVLFRFEKDFYARFGIDVEFVGNPLVESAQAKMSPKEFQQENNLNSNQFTFGLLPGSREQEIRNILPIMLKTIEKLKSTFLYIQVILIKAPTVSSSLLEEFSSQIKENNIRIIENQTYEAISACDFCIVTSGTATLEVGLLEKPMVILYKTHFLTWVLAKIFVKLKHIGLINIIAGHEIAPEYIQFQASPKKIASGIKNIITNEIRIADIKASLKSLKHGHPGSQENTNAANIILEEIS